MWTIQHIDEVVCRIQRADSRPRNSSIYKYSIKIARVIGKYCKLQDNLRFECIVCVLFRYNITFMIITYFLPMGSMCFTYSRYDVNTMTSQRTIHSQSGAGLTLHSLDNNNTNGDGHNKIISSNRKNVVMDYHHRWSNHQLSDHSIILHRVGVELWGSKSIGEATEAQTESIKSKRKVGSTFRASY